MVHRRSVLRSDRYRHGRRLWWEIGQAAVFGINLVVSGSRASHVGYSCRVWSCRCEWVSVGIDCVAASRVSASSADQCGGRRKGRWFNENMKCGDDSSNDAKKRWKSTFCGENQKLFLSHVQHARWSRCRFEGSCLALISDCATTELPTASQRLRRDLLQY